MKRMIPVFAVIGAVLAAAIIFGLMKQPGPAAELVHAEVSRSQEYVSELQEEAMNLKAWQKINPDVKYVLTFPDEERKRTIPVLATPSVSYVMKHNIRNEYDTMGSVFCDPSFDEPENLVIYGHSSQTKDWNFTFFRNYADPQYYRSHPSILLESESGICPCRIVSLASYDMEKDEYLGWADSTLSGTEEIAAMFQNTVENLIQHTDGFVYHGGGIVTLVTCDMNQNDTRYVIQAMREM